MTHPWDVLNMSCKEVLGGRQGDVQHGLKDQQGRERKKKKVGMQSERCE